jgi:raffinose synthase
VAFEETLSFPVEILTKKIRTYKMPHLSVSFPKQLIKTTINKISTVIDSLSWIHAPNSFFDAKNEIHGIQIKNLNKHMVLERQWWFWVRPHFGGQVIEASANAKPNEVQFILGTNQQGDEHILLLPLIAGDWRAYLRPEGTQGLTLGIHGGASTSKPQGDVPLMVVSRGKDPQSLVTATIKMVSEKLGTFKMATEKRVPEFVDLFGWCTWDAFYQDVSSKKVLAGLDSFKKGGVVPKFMILDDGWQDVNDKGQFNRFEANKKFPGDLKKLTSQAKNKYGVQLFGLWHALQGYWGGVSPNGPLAKEYPIKKRQGLKPCDMLEQEIGLVHEHDIYRFYQDFYHASLPACPSGSSSYSL